MAQATRMFGVTDPAIEESIIAYVKLLRASRWVQAIVEARLADCGLTLTQLGVMEALLHKGAMSQREIGRIVLTSPGNMTDLLEKLSNKGLVVRERSDTDRRAVLVDLSESGRALISKVFPRHAQDIAETMAVLSPAEQRQLGAMMRKLGMAAEELCLKPRAKDIKCPPDHSISNEMEAT